MPGPFFTQGIPYPLAILDTSNFGMMNMQWNLGMEKLNYFTSLWNTMPCFNYCDNSLLDPSLAIWQAQQNWNNGGCCSAAGGMWGPIGWNPAGTNGTTPNFNGSGFQFPGFNGGNFQTPQFPGFGGGLWNSGNNSGGSGNSTEATKLEPYKKMFEKFKKEKILSDETIKAYNEAMKKTDINERLAAVKEVFAKIDPKNIKAAALNDDSIKKSLKASGYYFDGDTSNNSGVTLDGTIENLLTDLSTKKTPESFTTLASLLKQSNDSAIIQTMSYWNNSNGDSIIKFVANNLKPGDYKPGVENFVTALLNEANKFKSSKETMKKKEELSKEFENVEKVFENYKDTTESADGKKYRAALKSALLKLAPKVDSLYAQIRMQQATQIDADLKEKYGELNNAKEGVIPENMISEATKKDLEKEKMTAPDKVDNVVKTSQYVSEVKKEDEGVEDVPEEKAAEDSAKKQNETGQQRADRLVKEGKLTKLSINGCYRTDTGRQKTQEDYYMIKNGELVKLNGWISQHGYLVFKDGKTPSIHVSKLKPEHYTKFTDDEIQIKDNIVTPPAGSFENDPDTTQQFINEMKTEQDGQVVSFSSSSERHTMKDNAKSGGYTQTSVNGYYYKKKGSKVTYYKYDLETQEFVSCPEIISISNEGIVTFKNKTTAPLRTIGETPKAQGKKLRELLHGDTSESQYHEVMQIMNSFSTYTEPNDIVEFIKGYNEERSVFILGWNGRIAAQISTENNFGKANKTKCLQIIAEKMLLVMDNLGYQSGEDDYDDMYRYANDTDESDHSWRKNFWSEWSLWSSERTGAANHMDDIINRVLKKCS